MLLQSSRSHRYCVYLRLYPSPIAGELRSYITSKKSHVIIPTVRTIMPICLPTLSFLELNAGLLRAKYS